MTRTTAQEIEEIKLRAEIAKDIYVKKVLGMIEWDEHRMEKAAEDAIAMADILIKKLNGQ